MVVYQRVVRAGVVHFSPTPDQPLRLSVHFHHRALVWSLDNFEARWRRVNVGSRRHGDRATRSHLFLTASPHGVLQSVGLDASHRVEFAALEILSRFPGNTPRPSVLRCTVRLAQSSRDTFVAWYLRATPEAHQLVANTIPPSRSNAEAQIWSVGENSWAASCTKDG